MINNQALSVLSLIKCGIYGGKPCLPEDFNIQPIYSLAKQHQIMGVLLYGLLAAGFDIGMPEIKPLYAGALAETIFHEKQQAEISRIYDALNKSKISFMPLKGALLKGIYPRPELRVMSDVDILIRTEEYGLISPVMTALGFEEQYESDHEIVWKNAGLTVEFHKHLIPSYNSDYHGYFKDVWDKAVPIDGYRFCLEKNDEFIYNFTHLAKHYRDGGIGFKHYIDIQLMLEKYDPNLEYVRSELGKLHLERFLDNVLKTLDFWFGEGEYTDTVGIILKHTFLGGAYGSAGDQLTGRVVRNAERSHSRMRAITDMVFPSAKVLKPTYKYLEKFPVLLPIAWISRWANALFLQPGRLKRGAKYIEVAGSDKVDQHLRLLRSVGIEYNLKKDD